MATSILIYLDDSEVICASRAGYSGAIPIGRVLPVRGKFLISRNGSHRGHYQTRENAVKALARQVYGHNVKVELHS